MTELSNKHKQDKEDKQDAARADNICHALSAT